MAENQPKLAVGIDLGSSYSR